MHIARTATLVVAAITSVTAQTPKLSRDWPSHGHDVGAQRYSPLKQINTRNVSNLRLAWTYDTLAPVPPSPARGQGAPEGEPAPDARPAPRQSATTPLVIDGVMYMGTMYNRVVALDAETGKEIWVKNVGHTPSTRGIAYWPGTDGIPPQIVFGTGDGSSLLISLNAKTGEFTPGFGDGRLEAVHGADPLGLDRDRRRQQREARDAARRQEVWRLGSYVPCRSMPCPGVSRLLG